MIKQSCLYLRGLTAGYSGSNVQNTQSWVDANMTRDTTTLTSMAIDGHGYGYICGFGSVFMNGAFAADYSFDIIANAGWLGNFKNKMMNDVVGALRQLRIMMDMGSDYTHSTSILVMSDGASVTDGSSYAAWGQFVTFLKSRAYNILPHTVGEIEAGAYGYDGQSHYFKQFSCCVFLLSASNRTLSATMTEAIKNAIKEGISFVVLQKGQYEGNVNFNAIFNPIGIRTNKNTYIAATKKFRNQDVSGYGNHIAWDNVGQLHIKEAVRQAQGYWYTDQGGSRPSSLSGQPGTWIPFMCADVDITDDVILDPQTIYRAPCCVEIGSGFSADFNITTYPYKPDDWAARLAAGDVSVSWANDNALSLQQRSVLFSHVVGYQRHLDTGDSGYTIYNGVYYADTRGFNVYVIRKSDRVLVDRRSYDIHVSAEGVAPGSTYAAQMAQFLNGLSSDYYVFVVSYDTANVNRLQGGLPAAMYRIGASRLVYDSGSYQYRGAYNCFGSPGVGEGNAVNEMYWGPNSSDPDSYYSVGYAYDNGGTAYVTGTDRMNSLAMSIVGTPDNTKSARIQYYKVLGGIDGAKTYGMKHTVTIRDNRFKKLPMYETKDFVVSVTNPCFLMPKVQSHDWVHVVNRANSSLVKYPFKDLNEYLLTTSDGSGQNEMCTSHLMMNFDMFGSIGSGTIYNSAGASHKVYCGTDNGNVNDPNSLYINTTAEGKVWHIYERKYQLITGEATRDSNDWQVHWKWNGVGSQGHNIPIDAGYEYIVFAYDRYGEVELAERHFFVPPTEYLPKWGANFYCRDFSNSTTFTVDRSLRCNAYCEKTSDNGGENGIMMIIRRPLFLTTGSADRTGWECIFNNNGTAIPRGSNYGIPCVKDYQYMVLCSVGDGAYSSHHFNAWNGAFDMVWEGLFEADSGGRASWQQDLNILMRSGNSGGLTMDCFISGGLAGPIGVFQVWRRPILCWEPSEVE